MAISITEDYEDALAVDNYRKLAEVIDADVAGMQGRKFTENDVKELKRVAIMAAERGECNVMELALALSAFNTIEY